MGAQRYEVFGEEEGLSLSAVDLDGLGRCRGSVDTRVTLRW